MRLNPRLIVFLTIVAVPFVGIFYLFISKLVSGGITRHSGYSEVDLKALGSFPFDQNAGTSDDIPLRWRSLDGKVVELQGKMFSRTSAGPSVKNFEFVYDVNICCFGTEPRVQERVFGHLPKGKEVELYPPNELVRLTGVLHTRVVPNEVGAIQSVFNMDVQKAEPIE